MTCRTPAFPAASMAARCWATRVPTASVLTSRSFSPPSNAPTRASGRSKSAFLTSAPRSARSEISSGWRVVRITSEAGTRPRTNSAVERPSWPDAPVMTMLILPAPLSHQTFFCVSCCQNNDCRVRLCDVRGLDSSVKNGAVLAKQQGSENVGQGVYRRVFGEGGSPRRAHPRAHRAGVQRAGGGEGAHRAHRARDRRSGHHQQGHFLRALRRPVRALRLRRQRGFPGGVTAAVARSVWAR